MSKDPLSIPQYYTRKLKDKRTEKEKLQSLAGKIKKVPKSIVIPKEYLVGDMKWLLAFVTNVGLVMLRLF